MTTEEKLTEAEREALADWFHQEFGPGCAHPSNSQWQCHAWAEQFEHTGPPLAARFQRPEAAVRLRARVEALADEWETKAAETRRDVGWAWLEPDNAVRRLRAALVAQSPEAAIAAALHPQPTNQGAIP